MAYLKTISGGEDCPSVAYFECDFCKKEIIEMEPMIKNGKFVCCEDCAVGFVEDMALSGHGSYHYWAESLIYRCKHFRKKRSCYLPKKIREQILNKYKFTCQKCGSKNNLTIDHIKPVVKGGNDNPTNLTILCKSCNSKKGSKYEK